MSTSVLLMVIIAAVLHASWNLGSRHHRAKPGFIWGIGIWTAIWATLSFPFVFTQMEWSWIPVTCGLLSGLSLALYYRCLERAYRTGDISIVYPIIRSSPLWVALAGVFILDDKLSALAWLGILLTLLGVFILMFPSLLRFRKVRWHQAIPLSAILFAFGASFATCLYTLSDKVAMNHAALGPFAGVALAGIASTSKLCFWSILDPAARVGFVIRKLSPAGIPTYWMATFGFCAFAAYVIIIGAFIYADAGRVLAVSNLSILLGSIGGILFFKERSDIGMRLIGLTVTLVGIILIRLY